MGEYIKIYMDFNVSYEHNRGLRNIIEYIGRKEYPTKVHGNDRDYQYKLGKKYINSKLNKWHLTAMNRLVESTHLMYVCDYECARRKIVWKIHRRKAQKIFKKIGEIISKYDDAELSQQFKEIKERYFITYKSVDRARLIGSPYYTKISDEVSLAAIGYSKQDISDLGNVAHEISHFST